MQVIFIHKLCLHKNTIVRQYTVYIPAVLYDFEKWTFTFKEEYRLKLFENKNKGNIWTQEG
jgi:hypothetical protein